MSEIDWSKAPEGATHYYEQRKAQFKWFKMDDGVLYRYHPNDGWEPSLRNSQPDPVIDLTLRPTQWRGPEDGLPPVGTVCEFAEGLSGYVIAEDHQGWPGEALEVLAHRDTGKPVAVVWNLRRKQASTVIAECLRSLKSDKERAVEAALAQDCDPRDGMLSRHDFCARLYDAGFLRLPEDQS